MDQFAALYAHEEIHTAITAIVGVVERLDVLGRDLKRAAFDAFAETRDVRESEIEKGVSRERENRERVLWVGGIGNVQLVERIDRSHFELSSQTSRCVRRTSSVSWE